jgi:AraC family transcriptional regulator
MGKPPGQERLRNMQQEAESPPAADPARYRLRMNTVCDYIDAHLAEPLDLHMLAKVAHFSPWHFHRLFRAVMGETVADRVRRRRLETAARALLASPPAPMQTIALECGFGSAEVFTRSFKARFDVTPSAWRQGAHQRWADARRAQLQARQRMDRPADCAASSPAAGLRVEVRTLPTMHVAYLRRIGPYGDPAIGRLWQRFARWAQHQQLADGHRRFLGVSHDSADLAMPDTCRYDACIEVDQHFMAQREVGTQDVAGGVFVCTRFAGSGAEIYGAWLALYAQWLPRSGWQPDDRPCVELYGAELELDHATGQFACELCLPVRPL